MIYYIFSKANINIFVCAKTEHTEEKKLIIIKKMYDSILGGHLKMNKIIKKIKKTI